MHRLLAPEAIQQHLGVQEAEALQLIYDLLDDPTVYVCLCFSVSFLF